MPIVEVQTRGRCLAVRDRILAVMERLGVNQAELVRRSGMPRDWVSRRVGVDEETGLPRGGGIQADELEVFARALEVPTCALVDDAELARLLHPVTVVVPPVFDSVWQVRETPAAFNPSVATRVFREGFRRALNLTDEEAEELLRLADLFRRSRDPSS